jgi:hypothetical protein
MFSLFTLDFTSHIFGFIKPGGWLHLIPALVFYFVILTLFSTISFHAIEMPFLRIRQRYVNRSHAGRTEEAPKHEQRVIKPEIIVTEDAA